MRGFCFRASTITGILSNSCSSLRGQIAEVLPTVCPRSAGLLAGICLKKSQSPGFSSWVREAMVTNDWYTIDGDTALFAQKDDSYHQSLSINR